MPAIAAISMLLAAAPLPDAAWQAAARTACTPVGAGGAVPGIRVEPVPGDGAAPPGLRITDAATGATMIAYHDAASGAAARAWAPCLGAGLRMVAASLGGGAEVRWHNAMFTTDPAYRRPAGGDDTRWAITVGADGRLDAASVAMVARVMPHEQVHAWQNRAKTSGVPRWVGEGHAEWVSRPIQAVLDPTGAATEVAERAARLAGAGETVALGAWGGVRPKREAILRQVAPDVAARMAADPDLPPPSGTTFTFTSADLIGDESNMVARYEAAWRLFRDMAAATDAARVGAWVAALTASGGRLTGGRVTETARAMLGFELEPRLR